MRKKLQVFVSSTFLDLIQERQAAVEAILNSGHIPAGMELFNAGNDSQLDTIKEWINESDIYMLILGGRYGSIEPKSGLSYTEIEYRYALEREIPVFAIYIMDDALELKKKSLDPEKWHIVIEQQNRDKYTKFRELVLSKVCRAFYDIKDIQIAVHQTLNRFEKSYKFSGWISGNDLIDFEALILENNSLKEKIKELESQTNREFESQIKPNVEPPTWEEISELAKILHQLKIEIPRYTSINIAGRPSILELLLKFQNNFLASLPNANRLSTHADTFLFENAAPILNLYNLLDKVKGNYTVNVFGKEFLKKLNPYYANGSLDIFTKQ